MDTSSRKFTLTWKRLNVLKRTSLIMEAHDIPLKSTSWHAHVKNNNVRNLYRLALQYRAARTESPAPTAAPAVTPLSDETRATFEGSSKYPISEACSVTPSSDVVTDNTVLVQGPVSMNITSSISSPLGSPWLRSLLSSVTSGVSLGKHVMRSLYIKLKLVSFKYVCTVFPKKILLNRTGVFLNKGMLTDRNI